MVFFLVESFSWLLEFDDLDCDFDEDLLELFELGWEFDEEFDLDEFVETELEVVVFVAWLATFLPPTMLEVTGTATAVLVEELEDELEIDEVLELELFITELELWAASFTTGKILNLNA